MSIFKGKRLIILILVAVAAGILGYWLWGGRKAEIKWRTSPVERGAVQVSVTATGTLQAVLTVQVGTQVSGTVSALHVDYNSKVAKGQVIARIDTTLLQAALSDSRSNLDRVAAQELQAAAELKRSKALFAGGLVSQSDLDQAVANASVASANLNSAKAQVDRARINLRYATIVSPIDGIVLSRAVDVGQTVAASFNTPTLFTIAGDLRQMQVQASVDEADIGKVAMGQPATFTVDAYPDSVFAGEVKQIRLQPVTVQNVVSYDVVIGVPNPELKLMPGMTASLTIAVSRVEDVLQVPAAALRFNAFEAMAAAGIPGKPGGKRSKEGGKGQDNAGGRLAGAGRPAGAGDFGHPDSARGRWDGKGRRRGPGEAAESRVFVLENGKPRPVRVRMGLSDGTRTEVTGPLEPGAEVITGVETKQTAQSAQSSPFGMPRVGGGARGGGGGRAH